MAAAPAALGGDRQLKLVAIKYGTGGAAKALTDTPQLLSFLTTCAGENLAAAATATAAAAAVAGAADGVQGAAAGLPGAIFRTALYSDVKKPVILTGHNPNLMNVAWHVGHGTTMKVCTSRHGAQRKLTFVMFLFAVWSFCQHTACSLNVSLELRLGASHPIPYGSWLIFTQVSCRRRTSSSCSSFKPRHSRRP